MKNKLLGISEQLIFDKLQWCVNTLNGLKVKINEQNNISDGINSLLSYCNVLLNKKKFISNTKEFKIKIGYLKEISDVLKEIYGYINNIKQVITQNDDSLKYIYKYVNIIKKELGIKGDIILIPDSHFESYTTFYFNYSNILENFNDMTTYFIYMDWSLDLFGLPLICHEIAHCWLYENEDKYKNLNKDVKKIIRNQKYEDIRDKIEELTCDMFSVYLFKSAPYSYLINSFIDFNELTDTQHFEDSFRLYMISLECKNNRIIEDQFFIENKDSSNDFKKYSDVAERLVKLYNKFMQNLFNNKTNIFVTDCTEYLENIILGNLDFKEGLKNFKSKLIWDK